VDDLPLEQIPVNYSAGRADEGISENLEFEEAAKYRDRIKRDKLLGH